MYAKCTEQPIGNSICICPTCVLDGAYQNVTPEPHIRKVCLVSPIITQEINSNVKYIEFVGLIMYMYKSGYRKQQEYCSIVRFVKMILSSNFFSQSTLKSLYVVNWEIHEINPFHMLSCFQFLQEAQLLSVWTNWLERKSSISYCNSRTKTGKGFRHHFLKVDVFDQTQYPLFKLLFF